MSEAAGSINPPVRGVDTTALGDHRPNERRFPDEPPRWQGVQASTTEPARSSTERGPPTGHNPKVQFEFPTSASPIRPRRLSWAELLKRVFAADALACPRCGGRMRLLATIQDPQAIRAIQDCLKLPSRAPPRAAARRESPEPELDFGEPPRYDN